MKVRIGFVSNSSSSSFLVVWPQQPTSLEDIIDILYQGAETTNYYDETLSTRDLAGRVWMDTRPATIAEIEDFVEEMFSFGEDWYSKRKYVWHNVGYKPNTQLMQEYEAAYIALSKEQEHLATKLKQYDAKEQVCLQRQGKLARVLGEDKGDLELVDYEVTQNRLQEVRKLLWHHPLLAQIVKESTAQLIADHPGLIAVYDYSDNEGQGCLEHNDTFGNLTHWINSHH